MKISVFVGDLCDAGAEALCTSTNPRLSLAMGTGGSIRDRGGYQILRECEAIIEAESRRTGRPLLPAGSAYVTTSGDLPAKILVHCVASDAEHRSSADIIRTCVKNALYRADAAGCRSVAMPLFATGHAHFPFDRAVIVMAEALRGATTRVKQAFIVVYDPDRAADALRLIGLAIPAAVIDVQRGPVRGSQGPGMWSEARDLYGA